MSWGFLYYYMILGLYGFGFPIIPTFSHHPYSSLLLLLLPSQPLPVGVVPSSSSSTVVSWPRHHHQRAPTHPYYSRLDARPTRQCAGSPATTWVIGSVTTCPTGIGHRAGAEYLWWRREQEKGPSHHQSGYYHTTAGGHSVLCAK